MGAVENRRWTPPILTPQGWLFFYHGVCEAWNDSSSAHKLSYSAGLLMLDEKHPNLVRYRSPEPVLTPDLPKEREGIVPNVVFPTAIDRRDDLGLPGRFDVYYGMADNRIGVARLDLPAILPDQAQPHIASSLTAPTTGLSTNK